MSETANDIQSFKSGIVQAIHGHWKLFLAQGIVMMLLGIVAISLPLVATLATEILVGWLFVVGGIVRIVYIPRSTRTPGFWWSLLTAVIVIVLGVVFILQPLQGALTLTMMLIALFILEGIAALFMAFELRKHMHNWGWTLFKGVVDLWLALMIWSGWPGSATWAIGLLVGINMLFFGVSLTMTALAARTLKAG
jgi:uncharacterized membrane protein HdeD (DUF308 family)